MTQVWGYTAVWACFLLAQVLWTWYSLRAYNPLSDECQDGSWTSSMDHSSSGSVTTTSFMKLMRLQVSTRMLSLSHTHAHSVSDTHLHGCSLYLTFSIPALSRFLVLFSPSFSCLARSLPVTCFTERSKSLSAPLYMYCTSLFSSVLF